MKKLLIALTALPLMACTQTGNMERGALTGAALGAAAGAIIGNNTGSGDAATGAIIGGVVGAAGGAYAGCQADATCAHNPRNPQHSERYWDPNARDYYYFNREDGCTYWVNGQFRGC